MKGCSNCITAQRIREENLVDINVYIYFASSM